MRVCIYTACARVFLLFFVFYIFLFRSSENAFSLYFSVWFCFTVLLVYKNMFTYLYVCMLVLVSYIRAYIAYILLRLYIYFTHKKKDAVRARCRLGPRACLRGANPVAAQTCRKAFISRARCCVLARLHTRSRCCCFDVRDLLQVQSDKGSFHIGVVF